MQEISQLKAVHRLEMQKMKDDMNAEFNKRLEQFKSDWQAAHEISESSDITNTLFSIVDKFSNK